MNILFGKEYTAGTHLLEEAMAKFTNAISEIDLLLQNEELVKGART